MKNFFYTLFLFSLISCGTEGPGIWNTLPEAFEVNARVEENGRDLTLTWSESIDGDGDHVTYHLIYGKTLIKGLTTRTYTIKNLPYETEVSGMVVADDGKGGEFRVAFISKGGIDFDNPENVFVEDIEFEKFLVRSGLDDIIDGNLKRSRVKGRGQLMVDNAPNISSLRGLEAFEQLKDLHIHKTKISDLSLRKNLYVSNIKLHENSNLIHVDVSNNMFLSGLYIHDSPVKNLEMTNNGKLRFLYLTGLPLENIDLTRNSELMEFVLLGTQISKIDLTHNDRLEGLNLSFNQLTDVNLKSKVLLQNLILHEPGLENLVLPEYADIHFMWLKRGRKSIPSLKLNGYKQLRKAFLTDLGIEEIDVSSNLYLEELQMSNNKLTTIDLSKNFNLVHALFENNNLKSLNLRNNHKLLVINTIGTGLSEICIGKDMTPRNGWEKDPSTVYKVCD